MDDDRRKRAEKAAASIDLLLLDVDGVLTDGTLSYDENGNVRKRFFAPDGLGIKLAQKAGVEVGIVTALNQQANIHRAGQLGITEIHGGNLDKIGALEDMRARRNIPFERMAFLGDDWVDVPPMRRVGLPMAVSNARPELFEIALWTSTAPGGGGAVREAIEFILSAQGKLEGLWREWGLDR